jgi:flagellar motor switch/type III secretory pathway protein FliN
MSKPTATLEEAFSAADKRRWNALSFEGAFADDGGAFAVIVMRPDGASLSAAPAPASLSGDSFARVRSLPVVADCIGARFEAPLRRVLSLKPGDVIPIDWRGGAASLMVGGKPFAEGFVGDKSGRRAIRL